MGLGAVVTWTSLLDEVLNRIEDNLAEQLEQVGNEAVAEAKLHAWVDTGETRDSIKYLAPGTTVGGGNGGRDAAGRFLKGQKARKVRQGKLFAAYPAIHLEFGTKKMRARPVLFPALNKARAAAIRRIGTFGIL